MFVETCFDFIEKKRLSAKMYQSNKNDIDLNRVDNFEILGV